ncbi:MULTISPECIES: hypothetical protein [Actinomyces]|uniref:Uncharacterized protein n=1 Tax=Actinomyces respiraculi TaxID=2744574 RepID=A0A7T0LJ47_9ACTO|nr:MULTISPECIES: hypothetical protein [Actinomyces]QPL04714.1 hypothetical protein ID810_07975 [Actinomyces respiraculi]
MPHWFGTLLLIAVIVGLPFLYNAWKEKALEKGGAAAKVAQAASTIGGGVERGVNRLEWIVMKGAGVVAVLLAVLGPFLVDDLGFKGVIVALVLGGYGIYLLAPGDDKWFFFPW